jgi:thymidylate synthase
MNKLDQDFQLLLQDILNNGNKKADRTGTGTISVFGREIRHNMKDGFPLLTTKKMAFKSMVVELLWFLRGDTNVRYLIENNCNIWNGDLYKKFQKEFEPKNGKIVVPLDDYLNDEGELLTIKEFVEKLKIDDDFCTEWGDLGKGYGYQWKKWDSFEHEGEVRVFSHVDQIKNLINDLKNNPDSRRLMVTAWNPTQIHKTVLPPCHYGFQCYTRELTIEERIELTSKQPNFDPFDFGIGVGITDDDLHTVCDAYEVPRRALSLKWNQRSCDTFLGVPFNIASYGLLLLLLSIEVNMVPEELIGGLGDTHLYLNHLEQAKLQISRDSLKLPTVEINSENKSILTGYDISDFKLIDYISHPKIEAPLSN